MSETSISVRFWGVRGSIPTPGAATARYGGNTACVEVRCGEDLLIFDAGSGIRLLGDALMHEQELREIDILFSHCHIDHLIGLPFFAPLMEGRSQLRFWGGNLQPRASLKEAVHRLMSFPLFPIDLGMLKARVSFNEFRPGDGIELHPGIHLRTALLRHPGGSIGFRLDYAERSLAYMTDAECGEPVDEAAMVALAKDADLMICDATYTDTELTTRQGWGHSSWQQSVRLAQAAGAKRLCLFHHDPDHDDDALDRIGAAASEACPGAFMAREGLLIAL